MYLPGPRNIVLLFECRSRCQTKIKNTLRQVNSAHVKSDLRRATFNLDKPQWKATNFWRDRPTTYLIESSINVTRQILGAVNKVQWGDPERRLKHADLRDSLSHVFFTSGVSIRFKQKQLYMRFTILVKMRVCVLEVLRWSWHILPQLLW